MQQSSRIAIFIDVDNLVIASDDAGLPMNLTALMSRLREEGQIIFTRAYGDWSQQHLSRYLSEFRANSVEMMQLPTGTNGKNTADVHLAVEALEMTLLPAAPDIIAIVSGDRDFVPLVQKIKRYGKTAIGMGIQHSTSRDLVMACNHFLFVDDILGAGTTLNPQTQQMPVQVPDQVLAENVTSVTEPQSEPDIQPHACTPADSRLREVFPLLHRAVTSLARQDHHTQGSSVRARMQQLNPAFYHERYGFASFKDFAMAAQSAGYVRLVVPSEGDFRFDPHFTPAADVLDAAAMYTDGEDEYSENLSFASPEDAYKSYVSILRKRKRLELIPWAKRKELVKHIWSFLADARKPGHTLEDIRDELKIFVMLNSRFWVEEKAIDVLVRTLCIAHCLESGGCSLHHTDSASYAQPSVDVDEALFLMSYTYVNGLRLSVPEVPLIEEAIARLLFDEVTDKTREQARKLISRVGGGQDHLTAMQEAFRRATNAD